MPCAQKVLLPWLEDNFPALALEYRKLFEHSAYLDSGAKRILRARVEKIRDRYGLNSGPLEYRPELWLGEEQASFELRD
jgi:hypothetical protein